MRFTLFFLVVILISCSKEETSLLKKKSDNYTSLEDGLKKTCNWFKMVYPNIRGYTGE